MVKRRAFTDSFLRGLRAPGIQSDTVAGKPYKLSAHARKGEGRLIVRVLPVSAGGLLVKEFFYRYRAGNRDQTIALGRFDPTGRNGKTLAGINKALEENRAIQRTTGDVREHREKQRRELEAERRRGSFGQLLDAYAESLRKRDSPSAAQVAGLFRLHVVAPFPTLAQSKAREIAPGDIQRILARMAKAGLTRQVNKVRSYLRAAFAFGMASDYDPRTTAHDGILFSVASNPAAALKPIADFERSGERVLSPVELREYWRKLDDVPTVQRCTLRFNLALACQRPTQLLRSGWARFDTEQGTLLLVDSKGRGGSRDHLLPLTGFAIEQLEPLRKLNADAPTPFSSDGNRHLVVETLSATVADVSRALKRSHKIPPFQQRDLRRTAETMLQKLGIDREVRAHLLSHGRSRGVQGKHYERYDFLPEKRAALEKWAEHIKKILDPGTLAKVINLR